MLNCSGNAVTNGYAIISFNNSIRYAQTDQNGNFSSAFVTCNSLPATCDILGIDGANQQQSSLLTMNVATPVTDAGNLNACGNSSAEYINFTLDATAHSITSPADSLVAYTQSGTSGGTTSMMGHQFSTNTDINLSFTGPAAAGTYPATYLSVQSFSNVTLIQPFNVVVTSFPTAIGQFYEGSFSGQFRDAANVTHTITNGAFRLRKNW